MDTTQGILLALVQGITEFLPISSSAHLVLLSELYRIETHPLLFDVMLHGATAAAVMLCMRDDIRRIFTGYIRGDVAVRSYGNALLIATFPAFAAGPLLYTAVDSVFSAMPIMAVMLIVSSVFLFVVDYTRRRIHGRVAAPSGGVSVRKGFIVGLFQILALLPGVSRSGITMAAGRLVGFSREEATRFSFLLAIPVIIGACAYTLVHALVGAHPIPGGSVPFLLACAGIAFAVAYAVMRAFLRFVERVGFLPFVVYQLILGSVLLAIWISVDEVVGSYAHAFL